MGGEPEDEFPKATVQRVQSLLTEDEAVRITTILSNLELNESDFESGFGEFAKETIKRYEQSNQKIERFKLCMKSNSCGAAANKLIVKALTKLGATRLILQIKNGTLVLPCEAVFGGDNLVELSVKGRCQIYLDGKIKKKICRLESLCLDGVKIEGDALSNIISSCPLIENLSLSNNNYGGGQLGLINTNLRCLVLCYESFKAFFPGDLLSKFPLLKDFTLQNLGRCSSQLGEAGALDVQISNCSLEHVKIVVENEETCRIWGRSDDDSLKVKLDVPSIRKFTFEGGGIDVIPSLSFVSSCTTEWESHVSLANHCVVSLFWFRELNELLTQLRQSKIHLSLDFESCVCHDYRVGDLSVTRRHEFESLTIGMTGLPSFNCYALLDGLFRMCRPKLITHRIREREEEGVNESKSNIDMLWDAFQQGLLVSIPRQLMYGLKDLEDVNAQVFEDNGWRPLLYEEQADQQQQQRIRFLLKWKPS